MPRGQKSKLRARERRRQARSGIPGPQATSAGVEEKPTTPSVVAEGVYSSSPASGMAAEPPKAPSACFSDAGAAGPRLNEGAKSKGKKSAGPSGDAASTLSWRRRDPFSRKVGMLMNYLLDKYKMQEPILKQDMLKIVRGKYRGRFPHILKRVSEHISLVYGLELKEIQPGGCSYSLESKLDLSKDGCLSSGRDYPKNGLLMPVLGVIFMNGNSISEKEIWGFINILGIYEGENHLIFGDVRKLLTQDLVKEQYLEYRQVPNSDPPSYEFLWGPRAQAEISKIKILRFLAKVNGVCLCAFSDHYKEALKEEEEARAAAAATMVAPSTSSHS